MCTVHTSEPILMTHLVRESFARIPETVADLCVHQRLICCHCLHVDIIRSKRACLQGPAQCMHACLGGMIWGSSECSPNSGVYSSHDLALIIRLQIRCNILTSVLSLKWMNIQGSRWSNWSIQCMDFVFLIAVGLETSVIYMLGGRALVCLG